MKHTHMSRGGPRQVYGFYEVFLHIEDCLKSVISVQARSIALCMHLIMADHRMPFKAKQT